LSKTPNGSLWKWLTPGIGVKRWIGLLMVGTTLIGLGIAFLLVDLYRTRPLPLLFYALTLRGLPSLARAAIAGGLGIVAIVMAVVRINRSVLAPYMQPGRPVVEAVMAHRRRSRGPKVVAIGGGTGLPTLLRGLKAHTTNLTAVITVADDGGSSGRLRRDMGVLPPGDFRNNIAALASDEALMTQLFQYRFGQGGLEGHSFGNLFITALSGITGSFEQALVESSQVLAVQGQVLPSTLEDVTLMAEMRVDENGGVSRVAGESAIPETSGTITRVYLQPDRVRAYPEAVRALLSAELIVLGPGSLFTSILPNLLVPGIAEALRASPAHKVYVCNIATQHGETEGFSAEDHVRAIEQHVGPGLFDTVLVNDHFPKLSPDSNFEYVHAGNSSSPSLPNNDLTYRAANLVMDGTERPWRHDSNKLAAELIFLLDEVSAAAAL
jgi:uncharacterized cofD-like protein